jgi:tight adherence protein C
MILVVVLGAACLGGAVFLAIEAIVQPRRELRLSLQRASRTGVAPEAAAELPLDRPEPERLRVSGRAAEIVLRLSPRTSLDAVALRLASAGLAPRLGAHEYLAFRLAFGVGGAVLGMVVGVAGGNAALATLFAAAFGLIGFLGPELWVNARLRRRRESIRAELPNALDLLTVSVEAGLGLDAALARLTETTKGPLADELTILLGQMSVGESRGEALRRLALRVDVPEFGAFARAVIQADQLGVSLGKTLRVQASDVRKRRHAAAEERAAKAPVKMLFPTIFCIFPTLFIVVLGPPILRLIHGL